MGTTYFLVSWADHRVRDKGPWPTTREYGTAGSKQAAIRLAERLLPPGAEYVVTTLHKTVHEGRTPRWTETSDEGCDRPTPHSTSRREPTTP
jgi:hypothetical protein